MKNEKIPSGWFSKSIAFVIGIDHYLNFTDLNNAIKDANDIAKLLEQSLPKYTIIKKLLDPLGKEVRDLFERDIPQSIEDENVQVIIYFAGHGYATTTDQKGTKSGYILPADASKSNYDSFISMQFIYDQLCGMPILPRHLLLILDCCFAGSFKWNLNNYRGVWMGDEVIFKPRYERFINSKAWQVLTSASYNQLSVDSIHQNYLFERSTIGNNNSPFVKYLIEALQGSADYNKDGLLTITEIQSYLRDKLEGKLKNHQQTPLIFPISVEQHDRGEYLFLLNNCLLNLPDYNPKDNPYKGLLPYTYQNLSQPNLNKPNSFFGRKGAVQELKQIVDENTFTIVYGASGTGKSSLVMAGIIPLYTLEYSPKIINPGGEALNVLSNVLNIFKSEERVLLYIDQLEELFSQNKTEEQKLFFEKLFAFINEYRLHIKVIASIRSDFKTIIDKTFENMSSNTIDVEFYPVPTLKTAELRQIITGPASERLIEFSPNDLVDIIVNEVENEPGSLPLLSLLLSELYRKLIEKNDFTEFTYKDYNLIGKVLGSIQTKANDIYNELKVDDETLKKIFLRMVLVVNGEFVKRRVFEEELIFTDPHENLMIKKILKMMAHPHNRLIVTGEDDNGKIYFEPSHDALIKSWDKILLWINAEGIARIELYHELAEDVKKWRKNLSSKDSYFWDNKPELSIIQSKFEQAKPNKSSVQKFIEKFKLTFSLGILPKIEECQQNYFNTIESLYILKSILQKRRQKSINNIIVVTICMLAFFATILGITAYKSNIKANNNLNASIEKDNTTIRDYMEAAQYENACRIAYLNSSLGSRNEELSVLLGEMVFFFFQAEKKDSLFKYFNALNQNSGLDLIKEGSTIAKQDIINRLDNIKRGFYDALLKKYYPNLVHITGGEFSMGSLFSDTSAREDEGSHIVKLSNFEIADAEITVLQYYLYSFSRDSLYAFSKSMPSWGWESNNPFVNISWFQAADYCNWLSNKFGRPLAYFEEKYSLRKDLIGAIRLPSEAEWEYAALSYQTQTKYSGSDTLEKVAWYYENSNQRTRQVRTKLPNKNQLYDMTGNVNELCYDFYDPDYYETCRRAGIVLNPMGPDDSPLPSDLVVLRGGSWFDFYAKNLRNKNRFFIGISEFSPNTGFRVTATTK